MSLQTKARKHLERALQSFGTSVPWKKTDGSWDVVSLKDFKEITERSRYDNVAAFLNVCRKVVKRVVKKKLNDPDDDLVNKVNKECINAAMMLYGIAEECDSEHRTDNSAYPRNTDLLQADFVMGKYVDISNAFKTLSMQQLLEVIIHVNYVLQDLRARDSRSISKELKDALSTDCKFIFGKCSTTHYQKRMSRAMAEHSRHVDIVSQDAEDEAAFNSAIFR